MEWWYQTTSTTTIEDYWGMIDIKKIVNFSKPSLLLDRNGVVLPVLQQ